MNTYEEYTAEIEKLLAKGRENWTAEDGRDFHTLSYNAMLLLQQRESKANE